jgi:hypothetical protein
MCCEALHAPAKVIDGLDGQYQEENQPVIKLSPVSFSSSYFLLLVLIFCCSPCMEQESILALK